MTTGIIVSLIIILFLALRSRNFKNKALQQAEKRCKRLSEALIDPDNKSDDDKDKNDDVNELTVWFAKDVCKPFTAEGLTTCKKCCATITSKPKHCMNCTATDGRMGGSFILKGSHLHIYCSNCGAIILLGSQE